MLFLRRRTGASRFVGLVVAASLALLAVLQGDVLCFCAARDGDHAHVCPSEADSAVLSPNVSDAAGASCSAGAADGQRLVSAPCDHVRVSSPDWFPPHGSFAIAQSFACLAPPGPNVASASAARAPRDVPRATSPPDPGGGFLLFKIRDHARS